MGTHVKALSVAYDPVNEENTFTAGGLISGRITLEVAKECDVKSLFVQIKGKADVLWTERYGQTTIVFSDQEKFFSIKEPIEQDLHGPENETISPGCYVYPFTLQIPELDLPPSFDAAYGKVRYRVKAYLSRSMRVDTKANAHFTIISRPDFNPELMAPQHGVKDKKLKLFNSGNVVMDVKMDKTGFYLGEGMQVTCHIQNKSSRDIKPKFCLYSKTSHFALKKRRVSTKDVVKEVGEPIAPSESRLVTRVIAVPPATSPSILNCAVLKHEYRLRVYLDVKYASDPEIKFPIVIVRPPESFPLERPLEKPLESPPGYGAHGFGAYGSEASGSSSAAPVTSEPSGPDPPPSYETYSLYPSLS